MTSLQSTLDELSDIMRQAKVRVSVNRERIVPSTLYDPLYHICLIACVLAARPRGDGGVPAQIWSPWLKLQQFVAARPTLLPNLLKWLEEAKRVRLELGAWPLLPRGYLSDQTHDEVLDYLAACGIVRRERDMVMEGERFSVLLELSSYFSQQNIFRREREVVEELRSHHVTKGMLGGA